MAAECCAARPARRFRTVSLLAIAPGALAAAMIPKCPLCLAAELAALGASLGALRAAPHAAAAAVIVLALLVAARWRAKKRAVPG